LFEADLHTHTVASGHAYGTIIENATIANERGIKVIAMTDHGPQMLDGPDWYYFMNLQVLPKYISGVRVLRSVEANILDDSGALDVPDRALESLELVLAGVHVTKDRIKPDPSIKVQWYTKCLCETIKRDDVDIIAHPGNPNVPIFSEEVVKCATEQGKALEINNNSFIARPGSENTCREIAKLCARYGTWVSIASDAHSPFSVGDVSLAWKVAEESGIKQEQIINSTVDNLRRFLSERGRDTVL
jgi:putative hydrolase